MQIVIHGFSVWRLRESFPMLLEFVYFSSKLRQLWRAGEGQLDVKFPLAMTRTVHDLRELIRETFYICNHTARNTTEC
jgi:hypothetical protein